MHKNCRPPEGIQLGGQAGQRSVILRGGLSKKKELENGKKFTC
jgi:hypothetical protein